MPWCNCDLIIKLYLFYSYVLSRIFYFKYILSTSQKCLLKIKPLYQNIFYYKLIHNKWSPLVSRIKNNIVPRIALR